MICLSDFPVNENRPYDDFEPAYDFLQQNDSLICYRCDAFSLDSEDKTGYIILHTKILDGYADYFQIEP
ncbi:MAG: hypothetical protein RBR69_02955 [Candidatus Cloacimonadaceae bacterium]|jgi:hypothetical protein|nr:hypothetical protein [Candidatus Cloacimonadota bacterium]MDY0127076.1 hypothetical protein [Candidatus Cloacimonadaceae bacterium]MCB5254755.1 hypothetical protein [Candidatus Cloacimonadota bacterium]MCK9177882.1 hypothetical protein [Candidatus Cloacimonadota bacterium]MCK9243414.1 hypothetical protein [Candidatus Cloacimonadota bacterium]